MDVLSKGLSLKLREAKLISTGEIQVWKEDIFWLKSSDSSTDGKRYHALCYLNCETGLGIEQESKKGETVL